MKAADQAKPRAPVLQAFPRGWQPPPLCPWCRLAVAVGFGGAIKRLLSPPLCSVAVALITPAGCKLLEGRAVVPTTQRGLWGSRWLRAVPGEAARR